MSGKKDIKPNRYTPFEISYIKDNLPIKSVIKIAEDLGRSYRHVRDKIYLLGLRLPTNRVYWYTNIKQYLKQSGNNFDAIHFRNIFNIPERLNIVKEDKKILTLNAENREEIKCRICNNFMELDNFQLVKGKIVNNVCKPCKKVYIKELLSTPKKFINQILIQTQTRSRNKFEFNIDTDYVYSLYIEQNGLCALTGIKMEWTSFEGINFNNISIDRISSDNGYIRGNIQLVCVWANYAKNKLSKEDFKSYIDIAYKYLNSKEDA